MNENIKFLQIHPADNVLVALQDLPRGEEIHFNGEKFSLPLRVSAKHKFALKPFKKGESIYMYGVLVGKSNIPLLQGDLLNTENIHHAAQDFELGDRKMDWNKPNIERFKGRTFKGFHRSNGRIGTANHWLVIPMVFCENQNVSVMKEAFESKLGLKKAKSYESEVEQIMEMYQAGKSIEEIISLDLEQSEETRKAKKLFPNIDGVKFLNHEMGCGGTRQDSDALCGLLAGYITHPNVAGATILSLGCQNAQTSILKKAIRKRDPNFDKPLYVFDQQQMGSEKVLLQEALKYTFTGLIMANEIEREDAPLSALSVGMECGGSDGFSGISANPAVGYVSDLVVALGGTVILSEFPELCGVEQELSDRCVDEATAMRFMSLMRAYNSRAEEVGSGFDMNPSPGNIRDGLITDAMKSAGAAKKGGTSPIVDVVDYPGVCSRPGLNLLCTPGNDVESTTAEVGAGANVVLFTTGLGTPTGNPIAPVIKISSNTKIFERMNGIIDVNCGTIIEGKETIVEAGERILDYIIKVASGEIEPQAVKLGQDDFIPWKRGISL